MRSRIRAEQERLQTSAQPVSAFMLVRVEDDIKFVNAKLDLLRQYGVTKANIEEIVSALREHLVDLSFEKPVKEYRDMRFELKDKVIEWPACRLRNIPNKGVEVEIRMPGIIASSAKGFVDNERGFHCEFMPPAFYSL